MFGLFEYTHDYYAWRDLICISDKEEKLIERYNKSMESHFWQDHRRPKLVVLGSYEHIAEREKEGNYFIIEPVEVL